MFHATFINQYLPLLLLWSSPIVNCIKPQMGVLIQPHYTPMERLLILSTRNAPVEAFLRMSNGTTVAVSSWPPFYWGSGLPQRFRPLFLSARYIRTYRYTVYNGNWIRSADAAVSCESWCLLLISFEYLYGKLLIFKYIYLTIDDQIETKWNQENSFDKWFILLLFRFCVMVENKAKVLRIRISKNARLQNTDL